jgi:DNA-binding NarL/FixJ family response regulator
MEPHVLIVDADASAAEVTGAIVRHITPAATIEIAATPERGWFSVRRRMPDVLIIDPSPDRTEGFVLVRLCQQLQPPPQIVVLTSAPTPILRSQARQLGVHIYLEKPAALAQLVEQLRAVLDRPQERPAPSLQHA